MLSGVVCKNHDASYPSRSYTIGKERLFLEVARHLNKKVYVAAAKRRVLGCLDLAPEYAQLLTTDHLATNLHAVPLGKVNMKGLGELLAHYRGRYATAVGFQPTGWTQVRASCNP